MVIKTIIMKKIIVFSFTLFVLTTNIKAVKLKFTVANMSVNVAEGSIGVFTAIEMYPNNFVDVDSVNSRGLLEFKDILYNDVLEISIEKTLLNKENSPFLKLYSFRVTDNVTYGKNEDEAITQGNTYVYRLVVITKSGQQLNLLQKNISTEISNPKMNCAKLNNVYRLAGHNNFQESVISPQNGGFYQTIFFTRVLELDVHASNNPSTWNWSVRHRAIPFGCSGNCNNCGYGTTGDKPFGFCIDDIKQWHLAHPNHDVIILFIDLKDPWNSGANQTPVDLDQRLLSLVPNADMIYKPRDLLGNNLSSNDGNMRLAAQQNNWPSMGDLTGKLMFVLTGEGADVNTYISDRSLDAVAFSAASVSTISDVVNLPYIGVGLKNDVVFYNMQRNNISNGAGTFASGNRYITRTWGTVAGWPKVFTNNEYAEAIDGDINNIAVKDVDGNYNPSNGRPVDGLQRPVRVENPLIDNSRIYSNYENVTQAATQNIVATNLVVEQGAHYRMIAGNSIDLQPGVDFQPGSDVDVRIDNCENADYTLRKSTGEQLTQEEIDELMLQLDQELYTFIPKDKNEIVGLTVYPNPANETVNIKYTNYLVKEALFTIYDLTGRVVQTKRYLPQNEGVQNFNLNISALKNGTYFYTLQTGQKSYNGKVIKTGK